MSVARIALEAVIDFKPTPEKINALPPALREYIYLLETRADPAGDCAARILAEDDRDALALWVQQLRQQLEHRPERKEVKT